MIARDAGRDVCVLESAGNVHDRCALRLFRGESISRKAFSRKDAKRQRRKELHQRCREPGAEKNEPRMFADEHKEDKVIHRKGARRQRRKGYRNLRGYFLLATLDEDLTVLVTF